MALDPTVTVRELTDAADITAAVVDAFARLIPQLSSSSPAPSRDELIAMATTDALQRLSATLTEQLKALSESNALRLAEALISRAVTGGTQGVMQVAVTAPQNQSKRNHVKDQHDHQQ